MATGSIDNLNAIPPWQDRQIKPKPKDTNSIEGVVAVDNIGSELPQKKEENRDGKNENILKPMDIEGNQAGKTKNLDKIGQILDIKA